MTSLENLRVGFGFDIHRFEPGAPLVLGGVRIEHDRGLASHTDGDAVCHAVLDALFTACGMPDIGTHYPDTDPRLAGASSIELLRETASELYASRIEQIVNLSVTVLAEHPRIGPHRQAIIGRLASCLELDPARVALAAGTNERFDAVGRGEALTVFAHVLLVTKSTSKTTGSPANKTESVAAVSSRRDSGVGAGPAPAREDGGKMPPPLESSFSVDSDLPPRAAEFERAVSTHLPPLPTAPAPGPGAELILYTDGASRGNPGPSASGWALFTAEGLLVHEQGTVLSTMTNNEAEYAALLEALDWIGGNLGRSYRLTLRMDSELIVKQLRGEYKVKADNLRQSSLLAMAALMEFDSASIEHVPRAQNQRADALANRALDEAARAAKLNKP